MTSWVRWIYECRVPGITLSIVSLRYRCQCLTANFGTREHKGEPIFDDDGSGGKNGLFIFLAGAQLEKAWTTPDKFWASAIF